MKKVLVIVVTYNGMPWLDRCLGSVAKSAAWGPGDGPLAAKTAQNAAWGPSYGPLAAVQAQLYVWDNASTDGSADYVAGNYRDAILVRSSENLGFSRPNNEGMKYALEHGYDYVYLLNQDAWLEPGALAKLVAAAEAHPEYGLLSPLQMTDGYKALDKQFEIALNRGGVCVDQVQTIFGPGPISGAGPGPGSVPHDGSEGTCGGPGPGGKMGPRPETGWTRSKGCGLKGCGLKGSETLGYDDAGVMMVPFVMAAHWLVPIAAIKRVGLFEEELFPLYGQDEDWCQRLDFCGLKTGIVTDARAVHDRAYRKEPVEKLVYRNFYNGSLVRLVDPHRTLTAGLCYSFALAIVKAVKYRSLLPFKYLRKIMGQMPLIREHRARVSSRA